MAENKPSPTLNISFIAAWFAPPPIQLPATVVRPRHTASGPAPPTISGAKTDTTIIARGPPMIIPAVPVKNMTNALGPNFIILGRSILIVNSTKLVGNKYRDATK